MRDDVILLTGAGFSSILGLPLTKEFNKVIDASSGQELSGILQRLLGDDYYDIEHVMYSLEEFVSGGNRTIDRVLLENEDLLPTAGSNAKPLLQKYKTNAERYLTYIKSELYKILDKFDVRTAQELYFNVLKQLTAEFSDSNISIFTTNYDLTFEKSLIGNSEKYKEIGISDVDYGFELKYGTQVADFSYKKPVDGVLGYYKIHGSIDWHFDEHFGCTRSGTNASPSNPNRMPILFPGFKGVPDNEHFRKLHDLFHRKCQTASRLIVVGFAFRDPYINDLVKYSEVVNDKIEIDYFNPMKLTELPKESGVWDFSRIFGDRLHYHQMKIVNTEMPFEKSFVAKK